MNLEKKNYEIPEMEVIILEKNDDIVTSSSDETIAPSNPFA